MANRLAQTYKARARAVKKETAAARGDVGKMLIEGLQEATNVELYARTSLPVTRAMLRSIRLRYEGQTVLVGYDTKTAPHAPIRLRKTGASKTDGHDMTMNPGAYIAKTQRNRIRKRMEKAQQSIVRTR